MKLWTLIQKELVESMKAAVIVGLIYLMLAGHMVYSFVDRGAHDYRDFDLKPNLKYQERLFHTYPLEELAPVLLFCSFALGVGLALLHFWTPKLTRTWGFLLHRSFSREAILASKLITGVVVFSLAIGIPWTLTYGYVNHMKATGFPPHFRNLGDGWIYITLGFVCYLATALSVLSKARWYSTKFFSLAWVLLIMIIVIPQIRMGAAWGWLMLGLVILLIQLFESFSQREF